MRIQRALARAGVASRRAAEELVAAGRVTVNGEKARTGQSVVPDTDDIRVDGKRIPSAAATRWILLHKPVGVMTTRKDPGGRKTVFSLVPDVPGLTYVGRLDYLTSGLLLLTNDGDAAHKLTHPSSEVPRTYIATVEGDAIAAAETLRHGFELDDGVVAVDQVAARRVNRTSSELEITLHEGKNREVRRICEALELKVSRLVRTAYGSVTLGALRPGEWRELLVKEVRQLLKGVGNRE